MSQLPTTPFPLLTLADKTSHQEEVKHAIDKGVINFFLEAWVAYGANELREKNMLDGVSPIGAFDLGRKIFSNIEEDFNKEYENNASRGSDEEKE